MYALEPAEALCVCNTAGRDVWSYITSPILKLMLAVQTSWPLLNAARWLHLSKGFGEQS